MDGFANHSIEWVSPASLNAWVAQPSLWLIERLMGLKAPPSCAIHRGTAVESGIIAGLIHPTASIDACVAHALNTYHELAGNIPNSASERAAIPALVAQGLTALRPFGVPDEINRRVVQQLEGVPVPCLGYLDLAWTRHGIVLDLKTTTRAAPSISGAHARQVALYAQATGRLAGLCYVTPTSHTIQQVANIREHVEALRQIAIRLERFLAVSPDPADLATLLTPDYDNYRWGDPTVRAHGRMVYGF